MPSDSSNASDRRRQRAGFSIFVDAIETDDGRQHWQTRLYHAESGLETVQKGVSLAEWVSWLSARMADLEVDVRLPPAEATSAIEVVSIKLLEPPTKEYSDERQHSKSLRAELVVELAGTTRIEQEIGRQVLDRLTAAVRAQWEDRDDER